MLNPEKDFLNLFGWDHFFESQVPSPSSLFPARVICEEKNLYRVQAGMDLIFWASVPGKMMFNATSRVDYPAVGDWVMVEMPPQSDRGLIQQVLPRKSTLHRKQVGSSTDLQILSTNVNYTFVTTSVNADLNYRRIERYLAMAWDAGTVPVILLTKTDLYSDDVDELTADVKREFPGVAVHALSKDGFGNAEFLSNYLKAGTTSVFIGSSGVGKSTLVNFLIGRDEIKTQDIREDDDKGRHTTTSRHLYVSRFGGLIIDTPGMRELQLSDHVEGVRSQFADIEEWASNCRFGDCQHRSEPGCSIKEALEKETLSEERWQSYQKLQAEVRFEMRKQDKALAAQDKKLWKKLTVEGRARGKAKRCDSD